MPAHLALAPPAPMPAHQFLLFLLQVGLLLATAFLLGRLAIRIGLPAIVGELCAGVLWGPSILESLLPTVSHWLLPNTPEQFHLLDAVGQVGVLLLIGITGMHMDLGLIRRRGLTAARISIAGIAVPLGFGIGIGLLLPTSLMATDDRGTFALFLGVAMGVSAIPVIAKTLMELRLLHRNIGQLTLSAVMVDDILGWILLSVVSAMATTGVRGADLTMSLVYLVVVLLSARLIRPLVRRLLQRVDRNPDRGPTIAVVCFLVLLAAAATHATGLEAVLGAFVIGIVISSTGALKPARLAPLQTTVTSVLAPLFFATAGLRMDLTGLADPQVLLAAVIVLAVAITGKFAGAYLGARLSRLSHWEGLSLGAAMNARGVIEVIIAMVGLRLGVLTTEMYTIIILVAIVTSLMAPPLLTRFIARVEQTAEEQLRQDMFDAEDPERRPSV
ncbi:cation:proton antiporter [Solwaraspora sp. WMMD1047]|uniref:cation:proton antiporter n=1 Tax=Solwaraspora sp. WMMD1047 TaxID=3016102 RepID=UPI0024178E5C|nr:cation:proton antiporter [Solwaraspora sp. WMMD1047]MDG4830605.1 cation:proton antiporter [Solwaraspora sp. WMMD1047]